MLSLLEISYIKVDTTSWFQAGRIYFFLLNLHVFYRSETLIYCYIVEVLILRKEHFYVKFRQTLIKSWHSLVKTTAGIKWHSSTYLGLYIVHLLDVVALISKECHKERQCQRLSVKKKITNLDGSLMSKSRLLRYHTN